MTMTSRLLFSGLMAMSLSGCIIVSGEHEGFKKEFSSSDWEAVERDNRAKIARLNLGESYDKVIASMGQANFSEAFSENGASYQVLYYRTHRLHSDGDTTKDETTPLLFKDKRLIGWGADALTRLL